MNQRYERKEGEDLYEYGLRLIEAKVEEKPEDLDWQDIVEATGIDVHRDSLRKAASVSPYSGYAVMQHFKKKMATSGVGDGGAYEKQLDAKAVELRKEAKRYYDQRREFNKLVDVIARKENLEDRLVEAANSLSVTVGDMAFSYYSGETSENEAVLVFCDWHYGMKTDNVWNRYNVDICRERVQQTVVAAERRIGLHKCKHLHVVVLGDMIHGAIHTTARVQSEELVCDQIMQVSEILAQAIIHLSRFVDGTSVYVTYGNHARTVQNKKESVHRDNMERLIPWWLTLRLKDLDDVTVMNEFEHEMMVLDICGYGVCCAHGDLDGVRTSPRLMQSVCQKKYGMNADYILLADKHRRESFEELGTTAVICGSLCGTDDYADGKRLYSTPEQLLLIFNEECGLDGEYHLRLK